MSQENEQNQGIGPVVIMPEREVIVRKMQGLGVLGISEQTNDFLYRLAEILDRALLNGAGLNLVWEKIMHETLSGLPPTVRAAVGMGFDQLVDAITPDAEVANEAKEARKALHDQLAKMAKAAEPNPDSLGSEDSLQNFERYLHARRVADLIFEYVSPEWRVTNRPYQADRRDERTISVYNQTRRGFFLEAYYGALNRLWTPWGEYGFGGSGSGSWEEVTPQILERLGATLYQPEEYREWGVVGPVYALHRIDDVVLPDPAEQPRSAYRTYEEVRKTWDDFTREYHNLQGDKKFLTVEERFALDDAITKARSEKEPPISESDIQHLVILGFCRGKVVKYTKDGGKTWNYAKLTRGEPQYFKGGAYGYAIDNEVMPHAQVHSMSALTDEDFKGGLIVRPTTNDETIGMKFSYELDPKDVETSSV